MSAGVNLARRAAMVLGFGFLYGPILILAAMSFNASRLVTVWVVFRPNGISRCSTRGDAERGENQPRSGRAFRDHRHAARPLRRRGAGAFRRFFDAQPVLWSLARAFGAPEVVLGLALLSAFVAFGMERAL